MTTIREALALAVDHHRRGNLSDAEGIYGLILAVHPDNAIALNNLGLIAPPDEAVTLFERAVAAQPDYVNAFVNLSSALQVRGEYEGAIASCGRALALAPDDPDIPFRLGCILEAQGKFADAVTWYEKAVAMKPDFGLALCRLGTIHTVSNRRGPAAEYFQQALSFDPGLMFANINMAGLLEAAGRLASAKMYRDRVPRPQDLIIETASQPRRTVLILGNSGKGNVPLDALLPSQTTTCILWYVEYATDDQEEQLPPYDVAINAIGDADVMEDAFARVSRFHDRWPVLNPPAAVARTRRDLMPRLLDGIPNVLTPPVVRLTRDEVMNADLATRLAAAGIACPVLVRPIAAHGGDGMVLAETPEQLAEVAFADADAFYFIAYHDYRAADGHYRKYRIIFVDRQPYAYHLAISGHWLVHYFSADMMAASWKREEERRFLENPASVLGPEAMAAIEAIGRRIDMDFAGIDFSVLPDGRVLVFEANATMLVHLRDSIDDFPYKHACVPAIFTAFDAMLDRRGRSGAQ
jgi:tetratricopeptide (TPR) repeat protein